MDQCVNNPLVALELEQSEHDWETTDMDMDLLGDLSKASLSMSITTHTVPEISSLPVLLPTPSLNKGKAPAETAIASSSNLDSAHPDLDNLEERVDISDHLTDVEDTSQPSPRLLQPLQVSPSQPTVPFRPEPFKIHKEALKRIEEENNPEVQASDESEAEEELEVAISEVQNYFTNNADLVAIYSNLESDLVQCPACNKLLGKTVYDVYQHALASRSKHNLIHHGVAAAIATFYGGQALPC